MYGSKNNSLTQRSINGNDYGRFNHYARNIHNDYDRSNRDDYSQSERESKSVKSRPLKSEFRDGTIRKKQSYHDDCDESIDEILIEKQKTTELTRELSNLRTNYDELNQKYNDLLMVNNQQKEQISLLEISIRTIDKLKQENETLRTNFETRLINLENRVSLENKVNVEEIKEVKEEHIIKNDNIKEIPKPTVVLPIITNNK